jgi:AhpD family alkylhydroperoxidase
VRQDFGLLADPRGRSPYLAHSPAPELLAGVWSCQYETMLVGRVPRAHKELVATVVSTLNECPFCVDAHAVLAEAAGTTRLPRRLGGAWFDALGDSHCRALARWAAATRTPASPELARPPFAPADAPEIAGTAVAFHYINRVVLVFLGDQPVLPAQPALRRLGAGLLALTARGALRRARAPGRSLGLLPSAEPGDELAWARPAPRVAAAFAQLTACAQRCADVVIPASAQARVHEVLARWEGADPGISDAWCVEQLAGLESGAAAVARVCLLTALAPYRLGERDVAAFRAVRPSDRDLVVAVCWAALATARRVGSWLAPAPGTPLAPTAPPRAVAPSAGGA